MTRNIHADYLAPIIPYSAINSVTNHPLRLTSRLRLPDITFPPDQADST